MRAWPNIQPKMCKECRSNDTNSHWNNLCQTSNLFPCKVLAWTPCRMWRFQFDFLQMQWLSNFHHTFHHTHQTLFKSLFWCQQFGGKGHGANLAIAEPHQSTHHAVAIVWILTHAVTMFLLINCPSIFYLPDFSSIFHLPSSIFHLLSHPQWKRASFFL